MRRCSCSRISPIRTYRVVVDGPVVGVGSEREAGRVKGEGHGAPETSCGTLRRRLDQSIDPRKDTVIDARKKSQLRVLTTSSPSISWGFDQVDPRRGASSSIISYEARSRPNFPSSPDQVRACHQCQDAQAIGHEIWPSAICGVSGVTSRSIRMSQIEGLPLINASAVTAGAGLSKAQSDDQRMRLNAVSVSAFANCGHAVAHVQGSYVP
jgi:hypothetical protein